MNENGWIVGYQGNGAGVKRFSGNRARTRKCRGATCRHRLHGRIRAPRTRASAV